MYPRKRFLLDDEQDPLQGPQTQMQSHQQGFYENLPEWASEKAPYVLETVSKRSPQRRRAWLAHGNVAQKKKELKQRRDEMVMAPMRQRQEMLQMNAPLGEREKMLMQQQFQQGQQERGFGESRRSDMIDFMQRQQLAGEGRGATAEAATLASERGITATELARQNRITDAPQLRPPEMMQGTGGDMYWQGVGQPIPEGATRPFTPQYDVFQDPGGRQSYLTRGDEIPEGMQRVSPSSVEVNIGPTERPSPSERTEIRDARASLDYLDNLRGLVDSSYVGPIQGRTGPMWALVGQTTQEQNSFYAASSAFKNMIIKQITGAQMSETEADRILKQVPKPEDPYPVWLSNWEQSKNNVAVLLQRQQEVLQQSGIIVPGETPLPWDTQPDDLGSMSPEQLLEMLNQIRQTQ